MPTAIVSHIRNASSSIWTWTDQLVDRVIAIFARLRRHWLSWSLARQFATCASVVLVPAMSLIGLWVSEQIEENVTQRAGIAAALYMENYFEPLVRNLAVGEHIPPDDLQKLSRLLESGPLSERVQTFKIWLPGNVVGASNRHDIVNTHLTPSAGLKRAWKGHVTAEFDHLHEIENEPERESGMPMLEVYFPIRERGTDRIIAVGEFYERAPELKTGLAHARIMSWLVVGAVTLSMLLALFAIVRRGSATILQQRAALEERIDELTRLVEENRRLRERAHRASARASENHESLLRRLGADLHDGPAQLISLALLRMGDAGAKCDGRRRRSGSRGGALASDTASVRSVLSDALQEIRQLSEGFAAPDLEGRTLSSLLATTIERHRSLTGSKVDYTCDQACDGVTPALKLCAYRFVQEGLSNAFRHAGGIGQSVIVRREQDAFVLEVADSGPGLAPSPTRRGLGLRGLADRIESLGGQFSIQSAPGAGTRLTARLPFSTGVTSDA